MIFSKCPPLWIIRVMDERRLRLGVPMSGRLPDHSRFPTRRYELVPISAHRTPANVVVITLCVYR